MKKSDTETVPTDWDLVRRPGRINKVVVPNDNTEPSKTWQAEAENMDVNVIMRNYQRTGVLPQMQTGKPHYGDFTGPAKDLHDALILSNRAKEGFQNLDPKVRLAAGNDPVRFLRMLEHPEGVKILQQAGLKVGGVTDPVTPDKPGEGVTQTNG